MINKLVSKKITLLSISVLIAFGAISTHWIVFASENEEKAVMNVLMLDAKSIESGDLKTLDKIWSHDDSVLIFESGGMNKTWKDYRDLHLAPELKAFKNTKFSVSEANVKVDEKTAWATYKYALSADYKDRKINSRGLGTMIFEKKKGKWLIVHSHTSARRKRSK